MNLTTRERLNRLDTASDRFLSIEDAGSHRVQSHAVLSADSLAPIAVTVGETSAFSRQPEGPREWTFGKGSVKGFENAILHDPYNHDLDRT
jgi:hypothetical protein